MDDPNHADELVPAGLRALGIEADEIELAVMGAAKELFWPPLLELLEIDLSGVDPEPKADLSRPPGRV